MPWGCVCHDLPVNEPRLKNRAAKGQILGPMRQIFGYRQVGGIQAVPDDTARVRVGQGDKTALPSLRQAGGRQGDPVGIHTEHLVKLGLFANGTVNQIRKPFVRIIRRMSTSCVSLPPANGPPETFRGWTGYR